MKKLLPLLLFSLAFAQAFAQVSDSALLAHYTFQSDLRDASGNGANGQTIEVGFASDGYGNAFSAGNFNGRSSLVTGPARSSSLDLTVSALVMPYGMQRAALFYIGSTAASGFGVRFANPGQRDWGTYLEILKGGVYETINADSNTFEPNAWQHIVMVKNSQSISIFRNGRKVLSFYQGHNDTYSPIYLGTEPDGQHNWNDAMNGLMDEARIYGRALNDAEVMSLYQSDMAGVSQQPQAVLRGRLFLDMDADCHLSGADIPMGGKTVLVQPGNLAVPADDSGRFEVRVDAGGTYTVRALPEQYLRVDSSCPTTVSLASVGDTASVEIGIQGQACYMHNVQYVTWARRRCFLTTGTVTVTNEGLLPAPATQLHLAYPDGIFSTSFSDTAISSDTVGGGQRFIFNVPALAARGRYVLSLVDSTACRDSILGQMLCANAHVDKLPGGCISSATGWDGSDLRLGIGCGRQPNELRYRILNIGSAMGDSTQYRLLTEGGQLAQGNVKLLAGDSAVIYVVDSLAVGYVLEVDQRPFYPGSSVVGLYGMACALTQPAGPSDLRLSFGDQQTDMSRDDLCLPASDSWDPNLMVVTPAGAGDAKIVRPGTRLEYRIYFQNEGTASTQFVTLQDTLPAAMDAASIRRGPESHPGAEMRVYKYGERYVVQYRWSSLALLPKVIDEARSQGFASFSIAPLTGVTPGTEVSNKAGIYFDYNPVVLTNAAAIVYDALPLIAGPDPVVVVTATKHSASLRAHFYPNPATTRLMITLPAQAGPATATVCDLTGKSLLTRTLAGQAASLDLSAFKPGIYLVTLQSAQGVQVERIVKR